MGGGLFGKEGGGLRSVVLYHGYCTKLPFKNNIQIYVQRAVPKLQCVTLSMAMLIILSQREQVLNYFDSIHKDPIRVIWLNMYAAGCLHLRGCKIGATNPPLPEAKSAVHVI
jgi:hypothetical protein